MIQILGWIATGLFTICYIPQIKKMVERKKVDDISFLFFFTQFVANIVALSYAILIHQIPLIVKYSFGISLLSVVLVYYFKYKDK